MELFGSSEDFFNNGNNYSYKVEYIPHEILSIYDNCNRMVPFDMSEVEELADTLNKIIQYENYSTCLLDAFIKNMDTRS